MADLPHAIITGGSSGIGFAIAQELLSRGFNLTLIARGLERLEAATAALEQAKSQTEQKIVYQMADVSVSAEISEAIAQAVLQLGEPSWLVLSAGIAHPGLFEDLELQVFEQTMAVNYFGVLYSLKAAVPVMRSPGKVVILSSGAGLVGFYGYTPYSPSKFALRGLAEALRGELKQNGLSLSIVYPPDTDTPQLAAENQTKPEITRRITGTAKTWRPEHIAQVVVQGVEQGKFAITPGLEMTLLKWFHSLIAPLFRKYCDAIMSSCAEGAEQRIAP